MMPEKEKVNVRIDTRDTLGIKEIKAEVTYFDASIVPDYETYLKLLKEDPEKLKGAIRGKQESIPDDSE